MRRVNSKLKYNIYNYFATQPSANIFNAVVRTNLVHPIESVAQYLLIIGRSIKFDDVVSGGSS
jgi:hypothetical protein